MPLVTVAPQGISLFIHGRRAELAQRNNYISSRFHFQFNHIKIIEFLSACSNSVVLQPLAVEFQQFANAIKTVINFIIGKKKKRLFQLSHFFKQTFASSPRVGVILKRHYYIV